MGRIFINRLQLTDFRNWASAAIDTDSRHVVLTGENGAGKTNLLESISFLSPGRGMRRAPYDAIEREGGSGGWAVFANLSGYESEVSIGTGIQRNGQEIDSQRKIRIDGVPARRSEQLLDHLRIAWLLPAMDGLFTGPAADRRRYLDRLVLAIDADHGRRVSEFERSMRSRNRVLSGFNPDPAWLDAIENQMAASGVAITLARRELIGLLSGVLAKSTQTESQFPSARISLEGQLPDMAGKPASDIESAYTAILADNRHSDGEAGRTIVGPHRDDLKVVHFEKAILASRCSTGEQKALLVGLLLAHASLVADMTGAAPLLLLDEIAAHLDARRRSALYDRIDSLDCQAWMTGTDHALFEALGDRATHWRVGSNEIAME